MAWDVSQMTRDLQARFKLLPENTALLIQSSIYALASALAAVLFLTLTNLLFHSTFGVFVHMGLVWFLILSFVTIMGTSVIVGFLIDKVSPEAVGSGIPQLKAAYWKELGYIPFKQAVVKFVAGILSIGGGASLGREGPTLFMGGSIAGTIAGIFRIPRFSRRGPAIVGAAAGLAAAFNTPLASITFVLEEIVGDINNRTIGRIVLAAVIGAFVVYAFIGRQPAFVLPNVDHVTWFHYLIVPLAALLAALVGVAFQRGALTLRLRWRKQTRVPRLWSPAVGAFAVWVLGVSAYLITGKIGVFGLGYDDLSQLLKGNFLWEAAGVLVLGKLAATIISYGLGGSGGIFSPLLFLGGMSGFFVAGMFRQWLPLNPSDMIVLSAVGMSAALGAVLKTPLSALLIVFEMTHEFSMVPGLMIGLAVSTLVSRLAGRHNFYDELLLQDGHELIKIHPPRDLTSWRNTQVGDIVRNRPVMLDDLSRNGLQAALDTYPYLRFPVIEKNQVIGMLTREAAQRSVQTGEAPPLAPPVFCRKDETVRAVEAKFLDNPVGTVLVRDNPDGPVVGVLTLHDLIRVQASLED